MKLAVQIEKMSSLLAVCPAPFQKPKKKGELNASMDRLVLNLCSYFTRYRAGLAVPQPSLCNCMRGMYVRTVFVYKSVVDCSLR